MVQLQDMGHSEKNNPKLVNASNGRARSVSKKGLDKCASIRMIQPTKNLQKLKIKCMT